MNWILGIIGAFVGAALVGVEDFQWLGGAVLGFFSMFHVGSMSRLRDRLASAEAEIGKLRQFAVWASTQQPRAPAPSPAATPAAAPAPAATPVAAPPPRAAEAAPVPTAERVQEPAPLPGDRPAPVAQPAPAAPSPAPPRPAPIPRAPVEPNAIEKGIEAVKKWFTEGNVPVKVGVLVLFAGVAAALRYAVAEGIVSFPLEMRYAAIAALGVAALAFGWRERVRKPAFGLALQGGGIGILLLTVFAAYRLYPLQTQGAPLLTAGFAFALVALLVAGSATLALLQNAMWLAVLGFLGGYLAPVLLSTGSGNHVALFSYYAVLNAAVFLVSWQRSWRLLNLVGFLFTFGVGTAWGLKYYQPRMFATVEPFLVLFFVFYVVIGLLYVLRQTEHRRPWVDGTLVFGTPLVAFPLQAGLLKDDRMGLAFSALAVAGVYLGLLYWLRNRQREHLLTEAYGALAIGFATLAVPLAFSAGTTAGVWALEGAGVAWLGIRQNRWFPWLAGLALQLLAAGAYLVGVFDPPYPAGPPETILLLNSLWLGAAILALSGWVLSLVHDRLRNVAALPVLLFLWATFWWGFGGLTQMDRAEQTIGAWQFAAYYLGITAAAAAIARDRLDWRRMHWIVGGVSVLGIVMVAYANAEFGAPLQVEALPGWGVFFAGLLYAIWQGRDTNHKSLIVAHVGLLLGIGLALSLQAEHEAIAASLAQGWQFLAVVAPAALLSLGLWRRPQWFAWPRAEAFRRYYSPGWFVPVHFLLAFAWLAGLFNEGDATPLAYIPLLNPLELALVGLGALLYATARGWGAARGALRFWPLPAFAFVTLATLRAVHHLHGEPWGEGVLDSGFTQAALTLVWTVIGVGAWVYGSKRISRPVWMGGAVLLGIVLLKMLLVDRHYLGDLPGILSTMVVGLLIVGVGWIAPSPPRRPAAPAPDPAPPAPAPAPSTEEAT